MGGWKAIVEIWAEGICWGELIWLMEVWLSLEPMDGRGKVWFRGGVDVEVLRGRPRGELVLAQVSCEVRAIVGERVVVEADHWAAQRLVALPDTVVVVVDRV